MAVAVCLPVALGWFLLRHPRDPGEHHEHNALRPTVRETLTKLKNQGFSLVLGRNAFPALALSADQRSRLAKVLAADVPTVLARQWNDALDDLG